MIKEVSHRLLAFNFSELSGEQSFESSGGLLVWNVEGVAREPEAVSFSDLEVLLCVVFVEPSELLVVLVDLLVVLFAEPDVATVLEDETEVVVIHGAANDQVDHFVPKDLKVLLDGVELHKVFVHAHVVLDFGSGRRHGNVRDAQD